MNFRPITDLWLLARPKVPYYGAYPSGFLERARALLGVSYDDPVLHVCGGRVRDYPFRGFGPNDKTLDLDPKLAPDFLMDARRIGFNQVELGEYAPEPANRSALPSESLWPAILVDRPYSTEDAEHYTPGPKALPEAADLLRRCLSIVKPGGRVGFLDFIAPRPPKKGVRFVALVAVLVGYGNRARVYSVYEKDGPNAAAERARAVAAVRGKKLYSVGSSPMASPPAPSPSEAASP